MPSLPNVLILHGDDSFAIAKRLLELSASLGDPGMADLNTTRLDAKTSNEDALRSAAGSMPFLAERRLVILTNPLARTTTPTLQKRFSDFLDQLPPTTALVLVIEDTRKNAKIDGQWQHVWETLSEKHWLTKWLRAAVRGRAQMEDFPLPSAQDMPGWIRKRAQAMGGDFQPAAAAALASHIGSDTRLAELEIDKLLNYVDFKRPVASDDVEALTAATGQVSVFDMVDAMAEGSAASAQRLLRRLLEEQDAMSLFGMVVRQYRLLLQAREYLDQGGHPDQMFSRLSLNPMVAKKLAPQSRRFKLSDLEAIYHRLLLIDEAAKTGQMPLDLALEVFVAEIGMRR